MTRNANSTSTQPMITKAEPVSRFSSDDGMVASCPPPRARRLANSLLAKLPSPVATLHLRTIRRPGPLEYALDHAQLVAQLVHQFLGDLSRRTFQHFGLLGLLRDVQLLDLLQVFAEGRLDFVEAHFLERLVLRLLDADQGCITQFVNARLDGQERRQRHIDKLKEACLEFAFHANAASALDRKS